MDAEDMGRDLADVLISEEQIQTRLAEVAAQVDTDYAGRDLLLVGVLKGAVMVMADFVRALHGPAEMDWMAVSSYGSGTKSSGVVRILKDLDRDVSGRHVLIVEDIIDSGLTLSWLVANLGSRGAASVEVMALLRKPDGRQGRRRREVRRLRHPQRLRRRLRPRLRRALPQPAGGRHARRARVLLLNGSAAAARGTTPLLRPGGRASAEGERVEHGQPARPLGWADPVLSAGVSTAPVYGRRRLPEQEGWAPALIHA